ncbi:MAG: BamA/TamA family outer membrane protein, partial [Bacteroidota bacterium]
RTTNDTGHLIQYHIGNVKIYPDLTSDTSAFYPTIDTVRGYQFVSYRNLFKPHKLVDFIYLQRDSLYRQSNLLKTQNRFSALPSWRLVNITPFTRRGTDTVDFEIKLTPANKYFFNANLEGSRNYTQLVPTGSLLGVGAVISVQNRNFLRAANLFTNNVRYGVELNAVSNQSIIQTQQLSYSGTVQFPRRVPGKLPAWLWSKENVRTILGLNLAYTNRVNFFTVRTFNTSWGYEKPVRKHVWSVRFPNIEYNSLSQGQGLKDLIAGNSSFNYIFNTGLILSTIGNYRVAGGNQRATNLFNSSVELSGLVASAINTPFIDSNLKRFIKVDAEFTRTMRFRRSGFALRGFLGVGLGLPQNSNDRTNFYLPFYRQYVAGGPNSMRAWGIRRLGPGSAIRSFGVKDAPDRFGDMRIELNGEYRFYMTTFSGVILDGALFTDVGNVWFLRKNEGFVNGEFQFNRLLKDIAIGTGLGLRIDFSSFLKLRFDYAFKVKNPTPDISNPAEQNKWFYNWQLLGGQLQFGIDYPF